jgi:hypothetical protein
MHRPEADRDLVPGIDRRDQMGELHQLIWISARRFNKSVAAA